METKLSGWGITLLVSALTALNMCLFLFALFCLSVVSYCINRESCNILLILFALSLFDLFTSVFFGPWPKHENVICRSTHRRVVLLLYCIAQVIGILWLLFAFICYFGAEHWTDEQTKDWLEDSTHLALTGIIAAAVVVLHLLLILFANTYRNRLTYALRQESSVLYGDEDVARDALTSWAIDPREIQLGRQIGEGFFGMVFLAQWRSETVVLKKLKLDVRGEGAAAERSNFIRELKVMVGMRHPRIVQFLGASTDPKNLFLITEYMPQGSLYDHIHDPEDRETFQGWTFETRLQILRDVAMGLNYLHFSHPPIIHRDLTSNNVLLDEHLRAKVADFGLSRKTARKMSRMPGNILYQAPELMRLHSDYTAAVDIYSFGILAWELLSGRQPYVNIPVKELKQKVGKEGVRPDVNQARAPPQLIALLQQCWAQDPFSRPTTPEVVQALNAIDQADASGAFSTPQPTTVKTPLLHDQVIPPDF